MVRGEDEDRPLLPLNGKSEEISPTVSFVSLSTVRVSRAQASFAALMLRTRT
jgi:hypothetical protein